MTEQEWLASTDPRAMLKHLQPGVDSRKLFLVAGAWGRRLGKQLQCLADDWTNWLRMTERIADGAECSEDYQSICSHLASSLNWSGGDGMSTICLLIRGGWLTESDLHSEIHPNDSGALDEAAVQCHLLRDVFGNPFRPVEVSSWWKTTAVTTLARSIYDEQCFGEMPRLADELESAGCTDVEILSHCCSLEEHVRGCWVLDLLLDKVKTSKVPLSPILEYCLP